MDSYEGFVAKDTNISEVRSCLKLVRGLITKIDSKGFIRGLLIKDAIRDTILNINRYFRRFMLEIG